MRGSCQEKAERLHSLACHQRVCSWMQQSGARNPSSPDGHSGQGHGSLSQNPASPPISPSSPDSCSSSCWFDLPTSICRRNSFSSDAPLSPTTQGALTCVKKSHRPIESAKSEEAPCATPRRTSRSRLRGRAVPCAARCGAAAMRSSFRLFVRPNGLFLFFRITLSVQRFLRPGEET